LLLGLAVKLVALGKLALIQLGKGSTHPGMNGRSARFDDDGNLIVVTVNEPVEGTCQAQRFDLRFFRPFRADLSIRKFPSRRFDRPEQSLGGQPRRLSYPSSSTAFQSQPEAQEAFHQLAFAGS
jgi:hypothetical protein